VGLLWRLFAPRPLKRARRALHPSWVIEDAIARSARRLWWRVQHPGSCGDCGGGVASNSAVPAGALHPGIPFVGLSFGILPDVVCRRIDVVA
jgi:hypothetical protein